VVLNRFLVLADALKQRIHAHREQLVMNEGDLAQKIERLD
jgi:ribosome-binding protein aMBF1 (putative translation factor)